MATVHRAVLQTFDLEFLRGGRAPHVDLAREQPVELPRRVINRSRRERSARSSCSPACSYIGGGSLWTASAITVSVIRETASAVTASHSARSSGTRKRRSV